MFPDNTYGRHHVTLEGTLEIKAVKKEDAGYYVCSAFSVAGSGTTRAFLEVSIYILPFGILILMQLKVLFVLLLLVFFSPLKYNIYGSCVPRVLIFLIYYIQIHRIHMLCMLYKYFFTLLRSFFHSLLMDKKAAHDIHECELRDYEWEVKVAIDAVYLDKILFESEVVDYRMK